MPISKAALICYAEYTTMNYTIEAVILSSKDIKEVDRIYHVFSRERGKLRLVGRGVRKPTAKLAGGLEPLTRGELWVIKSKWLDKITGVVPGTFFPMVDFEAIRLALLTCEVVAALTPEEEPNEQLFDALDTYLDRLPASPPEKQVLLTVGLLLKTIRFSGFEPLLQQCSSCGRPITPEATTWFHIPRGVECEACHTHQLPQCVRIEPDTRKLVKFFMHQPLHTIGKLRLTGRPLLAVRRLLKLLLGELTDGRIVW